MPWFPEFVAAAELARREIRAAGQADPVAQYLTALDKGDAHTLETVWPGEVVIYDPRAGEIRGHRQLRRFVKQSQALLADRHVSTETVASTCVGGRAVVELLAHLVHDGRRCCGRWQWSPNPPTICRWCSAPTAASGRSTDTATSGLPSSEPGHAHPGDVVGRYQAALDAGDADAIVSTFATDGYYREPIGPHRFHRGPPELRSFFSRCFSAGGGIGLQHCAVTDDGVRCALEYNCVRWGSYDLPPQAGIAVFERGPDGLLAAARVYDDVEPPVDCS